MEEKDRHIETLQQDSKTHSLTFVAEDSTVAAQFKGMKEKNDELQKQLDFFSRHKKFIVDSSESLSKKLYNVKLDNDTLML